MMSFTHWRIDKAEHIAFNHYGEEYVDSIHQETEVPQLSGQSPAVILQCCHLGETMAINRHLLINILNENTWKYKLYIWQNVVRVSLSLFLIKNTRLYRKDKLFIRLGWQENILEIISNYILRFVEIKEMFFDCKFLLISSSNVRDFVDFSFD